MQEETEVTKRTIKKSPTLSMTTKRLPLRDTVLTIAPLTGIIWYLLLTVTDALLTIVSIRLLLPVRTDILSEV